MLVKHIEFYKCLKVTAIGEDAMRVVQRVQYNPKTNKMVGFVLPSTEEGALRTNLFLATSFDQMQQCFADSQVAHYQNIHQFSFRYQ